MSITTANEQGTHHASQALPLTANTFLQGCAAYDYPAGGTIPTVAIYCTATDVTVGAQLLPGYSTDMVVIRYFALFK